ncbi:hypothetical protein, partial [Fischerella thermalis]|uniref:hypothetical protein n=1 Tax=Fischerella thermalis TaxID=372787 RepID=UPI00307FA5C2
NYYAQRSPIGVYRCESVFDVPKNIFPATDLNSTELLCTAIAHRCESVFDFQKKYLPSHRPQLNRTTMHSDRPSVCIGVKFFEIVPRWKG